MCISFSPQKSTLVVIGIPFRGILFIPIFRDAESNTTKRSDWKSIRLNRRDDRSKQKKKEKNGNNVNGPSSDTSSQRGVSTFYKKKGKNEVGSRRTSRFISIYWYINHAFGGALYIPLLPNCRRAGSATSGFFFLFCEKDLSQQKMEYSSFLLYTSNVWQGKQKSGLAQRACQPFPN